MERDGSVPCRTLQYVYSRQAVLDVKTRDCMVAYCVAIELNELENLSSLENLVEIRDNETCIR